jgi:hypothetical protein
MPRKPPFDWDAALDDGDCFFDWATLRSEYAGHELYMQVMRDAAIDSDGVRQPATAAQMQRVADRLGCMLLTPKLVDLVWRQAALRFDAVVNVKGKIVAECSVDTVHAALEETLRACGPYPEEGCVACVGKYWVVSNALARPKLRYGKQTACNYGWFSSRAPAKNHGVTGGDVHPWQTLGTRHNDQHVDPSQVVRLVQRRAWLVQANGDQGDVDLHSIAADPALAPLINHDGVLKVLRQPSVPEEQPVTLDDGTVVLPEMVVKGKPGRAR